MHNLEIAFLKLPQIVGDKRATPPVPPLIPVSKSTWLNGCRSGRFPMPVKLGPRSVAWRVQDIRALIEQLGLTPNGGAGPAAV